MLAMKSKDEKLFLQVLNGRKGKRVPFWFMRQAGRYLPEYRELRAKAGGFLDLVYDPEKASEVTIQPIRRFGMDAAILFSDILVTPQALGQDLRFETGEGPKLKALQSPEDIQKLDIGKIDETLNPIYETVARTKEKLSEEGYNDTALIGFAGSPWTVACYMVEGGGSKDFARTKNWAQNDPQSFQNLIDLLVETTIHYLKKQIKAGAETIQLFDSWAGILDEDGFTRWVIEPTKKIIQEIRAEFPAIPIIGFPRQAGELYLPYVQQANVSAVGLDFNVSNSWVKENLQSLCRVQGNLDPTILLNGGAAMEKAALEILEVLGEKPFIFNLGHGVIKETPPDHVSQLCDIIRNFQI